MRPTPAKRPATRNKAHSGPRVLAPPIGFFPLPLWVFRPGRGWHGREAFVTGEGLSAQIQCPRRYPSSAVASRRHLLPQGEKGDFISTPEKEKPRATSSWSHGAGNTLDESLYLTRSLHANRGPLRLKTLWKLFRLELQRGRIDAVAQAGRSRTVLEDVAEMAIAFRAQDLGANHAVGDVAFLVDMAVRGRRGETRPAAAGIELGVGFEQRLPAAGAGIGARRCSCSYSPENGRSVAFSRSTAYCIGVSSRRHSASLFSTLVSDMESPLM